MSKDARNLNVATGLWLRNWSCREADLSRFKMAFTKKFRAVIRFGHDKSAFLPVVGNSNEIPGESRPIAKISRWRLTLKTDFAQTKAGLLFESGPGAMR